MTEAERWLQTVTDGREEYDGPDSDTPAGAQQIHAELVFLYQFRGDQSIYLEYQDMAGIMWQVHGEIHEPSTAPTRSRPPQMGRRVRTR